MRVAFLSIIFILFQLAPAAVFSDPSAKAVAWADANEWFTSETHSEMREYALRVHQDIAEESLFPIDSDAYYNEIDRRMRLQFPVYFRVPQDDSSINPPPSNGRIEVFFRESAGGLSLFLVDTMGKFFEQLLTGDTTKSNRVSEEIARWSLHLPAAGDLLSQEARLRADNLVVLKEEGYEYVAERLSDGSYRGRVVTNKFSYHGSLKMRNPHGHGVMLYADGRSYTGSWFEGEHQGAGILQWENGDVYEGEFLDGSMHGYGELRLANGSAYDGAWVSGKKHGKGRYQTADGFAYSGDWEDNFATGLGKLEYGDGSSYEGEVVDGNPHGVGQRITSDGTYTGEFEDGWYSGKGIYKTTSGDWQAEGVWENGKLEGTGWTYGNSEAYSGEFKDGKRHGFGYLTQANGWFYKGSFEDGTLSGWGSLTSPGDFSTQGDFKNGKPVGRHLAYFFSDGRTDLLDFGRTGDSFVNISQREREEAIRKEEAKIRKQYEDERRRRAGLALAELGLGIMSGSLWQRPRGSGSVNSVGAMPSISTGRYKTCNYQLGADFVSVTIPSSSNCSTNRRFGSSTGYLRRGAQASFSAPTHLTSRYKTCRYGVGSDTVSTVIGGSETCATSRSFGAATGFLDR